MWLRRILKSESQVNRAFPAGEHCQAKMMAAAEAGAAFVAQSCTEASVSPALCQQHSLVFLCVPAGWEGGAGGGQEPPRGTQHLLSLGSAGEGLWLQCPACAKHTSQGWRWGARPALARTRLKGCPQLLGQGLLSTGTWRCFSLHRGHQQPKSTPRDSWHFLVMAAWAACRGAQTAIPGAR